MLFPLSEGLKIWKLRNLKYIN